ncbi:MAG: hypothetical protein J0M10_06445 [Chitinophagales bacterium]|nr:hypothetical protein [Chitinophagales bacterium]
MKKMLITLLFIAGLGTGLMAQKTTNAGNGPGTRKANSAYVDANKNKVCDNYENRTAVSGRGQGYGRRAGFGPGNGNCRRGNNGAGPCRRRG